MGFFKTEEQKAEEARQKEQEKKRKHDSFVAKSGERFCKYFTGFGQDLMAYEALINGFLIEYPEYKMVAMTSGTTSMGATVLCYFEKIKME